MADVNLREYLAQLDQLMQEGSADEVLWHARHILQFYPKNVLAYRYTGRALLALGRWDEASAALRRVLSVLPNDKIAHRLLSEVSQRKNLPDQAIWHMERAFEQDPSDPDVITDLQRLYRQYRDLANPRLQLTTAAVARQDLRSGELDRAIDTLRSALNRSPARADLRLLLAEALWQRGERIDAAELALDVLQSYPDSLDANRMLAELWLSENRPTDAQVYLNHVEAIDPYLALELVQGRPADDDTFHLPELDYQRRAQAELVSRRPDWLEGIDTPTGTVEPEFDETPELTFDESFFEEAAPTPEPAAQDQQSDWLNELDSIELNYTLNTGVLQQTTSPLTEDEAPDVLDDDELPDLTTLTDEPLAVEWASDDELDFPAEEDPLAWMNAPEEVPEEIEHVEQDPLAWMKNSGIEESEGSSVPFDDDDVVIESAESDPLQWLTDYQSDDVDETAAELASQATDEVPRADSAEIESEDEEAEFSLDEFDLDEELPFPDFDSMLDAPRSSDRPFESSAAPPTMPLPNRFGNDTPEPPQAADALDEWELNESLLDESLGLEELSAAAPPEPVDEELPDAVPPFGSPLPKTAELPEMSADEWAELEASAIPSQPVDREDTMPDQTTPESDWLDDEFEPSQNPPSGSTGMIDWLSKNKDTVPETDSPASQAFEDDPSTGSTGMLDWLSQSDAELDESASAEDIGDEANTGSTGMLNWLSQNRPLPSTMPLNAQPPDVGEPGDEETPEWLTNLDDTDEETPSMPSTHEGTGATEMLGWLQDNEMAEPTGADQSEEGEPDATWLAKMFDEQQESDAAPEAPSGAVWDEDLNWETEVDEQSVDEVAQPEQINDFMPEDESTVEGVSASDWLSASFEASPEEAEADAESAYAAVSDWAEDDSAALGTEMSDWADELRSETEVDEESFSSAADWLEANVEASLDAEEASELEESVTGGDWMTEETSEEESEVVPADLDWLEANVEASLDDEEDAQPEENAVSDDWMSDDEQEDAAEAVSADLDWLEANVEASLDDEDDAQPEENAVSDDWMSDDEQEEAAEAVSADLDWLEANVEASLDDEEDAQPEENAASEDWMSDDEQEEAAEAVSADLDWLEANVEASLDDEEDAQPEESAAGDAWLMEDEPNDEEEFAAEQDAITAMMIDNGEEQSLPNWMDDVTGEEEPAESDAEVFASQDADVYSVDDDSAFDEVEPESVTPDWLQAAAPVDEISADDLQDEQEVFEPEALADEAADWDADILEDEPEMPEPVSASVDSDDEFETADPYYAAFEDANGVEEVDIAPADNAPDWLNAMVPGLDIDYSANEDEPIETEYLEEPAATTPTMPADYQWLVDVVDEESQADAPAAEAVARVPRFIFSRPPVWLRRLLEGRSPAPTDEEDLPEWLR